MIEDIEKYISLFSWTYNIPSLYTNFKKKAFCVFWGTGYVDTLLGCTLECRKFVLMYNKMYHLT